MKYPASHLTPFLASSAKKLRVSLPHGAPVPTVQSRRNPSVFASPLFSTIYELPPQTDRFLSPAFSSTYELLFSQLPCFQKHLRCPLVFSLTVKFPSVSRPNALPTTHYPLFLVMLS